MDEKRLYRVYSEYLREKYGTKVYKLPVNLPTTCPNRDGCVGKGGCIFCGEEGAGFESLDSAISVREQMKKNMDYIRKRYKAQKFIAYFQNFTNTYMDIGIFEKAMKDALIEDVIEISISTRPDCVSDVHLDILKDIKEKHHVEITIELGLQSVNYHTLKIVNRGHTLGEFIDSVLRIKKYGFQVCTHLILNLPWDNNDDVIENAKVLSALSIDHVKLHSLYIVENTILGTMYKKGNIQLITKDEYIERVIAFLEYLKEDIIIQRLIGRAPEENTLFVNWNTSWWKIKDEIVLRMIERETFQGIKCSYLNGNAVKKFIE